VDPGDDGAGIVAECRRRELVVRGVLLTHAHVDHIRGVGAVAAAFGCPVRLSPADLPLYRSPANALPPWLAAAVDLPAPGTVPADLPGLAFEILETPGHTPGGGCYFFPEAGVVFTGDTLFAGAIGRADLPGGDHGALLRSIRDRLLPLPDATRVLPGHGAESTIGAERRQNPYLR
jgi:glyoxylase-like metal-dependent hydrolase (beta-lactamase superfamily II)